MKRKNKTLKSQHVIYSSEEMWVLSSPIRVDVLNAACALGECSVAEIADHTGRTRTSLYPHIEQLVEAGLLIEGETRLAGKRYEQLYTPIARNVGTKHQWDDPDNVAYHQAYGNAVGRMMARLHERATADPKSVVRGPTRDTYAGVYAAWVDDEKLEEINAHIEAIAELSTSSKRTDESRLVHFGIMLASDRRTSS